MVGLILISHSPKLVEGIRDIVDEMAKGIPLYLAGGNSEGGLGSSYELIKEVLLKAYSPEGVIILYDIGSSFMTAELILEELGNDIRSSIKIMKGCRNK
jgi:dihydroxyacetone kinase DhaKLM complex PTS-EIIA-like component DhaM